MAINKTRPLEAGAADFNFEATNPFDDWSNELFDKPMTQGYQAIQNWLTAIQDCRLVYPPTPTTQTDRDSGDRHKLHQVCGLYSYLLMEIMYGAFINADGCGTGKLHALISHIVASIEFWKKQELSSFEIDEDHNRPTLVVVPRSLLEKTYEELRDQLRLGSKVFKCNFRTTPQRQPLLFDPAHSAYKSKDARRTIVVVALSQLQACGESESDAKMRKGLFTRILVDEAQIIQHVTRPSKVGS
ncbi:hypothetical protein N0V86_009182 [Didymella sp. IMI 355093]|nr:hypothetical protein N0V86_009182 [Didymella sp. IMI 355093]